MPVTDRYLTSIRTRSVLVLLSPFTQYHRFLVHVKFWLAVMSTTVEQVSDQLSRIPLSSPLRDLNEVNGLIGKAQRVGRRRFTLGVALGESRPYCRLVFHSIQPTPQRPSPVRNEAIALGKKETRPSGVSIRSAPKPSGCTSTSSGPEPKVRCAAVTSPSEACSAVDEPTVNSSTTWPPDCM